MDSLDSFLSLRSRLRSLLLSRLRRFLSLRLLDLLPDRDLLRSRDLERLRRSRDLDLLLRSRDLDLDFRREGDFFLSFSFSFSSSFSAGAGLPDFSASSDGDLERDLRGEPSSLLSFLGEGDRDVDLAFSFDFLPSEPERLRFLRSLLLERDLLRLSRERDLLLRRSRDLERDLDLLRRRSRERDLDLLRFAASPGGRGRGGIPGPSFDRFFGDLDRFLERDRERRPRDLDLRDLDLERLRRDLDPDLDLLRLRLPLESLGSVMAAEMRD